MPCSVYSLLNFIDEVMQVIAPFLAIVLRDTLQFTDYVSVAECMTGEIPYIPAHS